MKRRMALVVIFALGLTLIQGIKLYAQLTKDTQTGLDRLDCTIQSLYKDKSTMRVKESGTLGAYFQVAYNDKTVITANNKPAKVDDLKEGIRIIILGKSENNVLNAVRIEIRPLR
jgi:hypothetical protein